MVRGVSANLRRGTDRLSVGRPPEHPEAHREMATFHKQMPALLLEMTAFLGKMLAFACPPLQKRLGSCVD